MDNNNKNATNSPDSGDAANFTELLDPNNLVKREAINSHSDEGGSSDFASNGNEEYASNGVGVGDEYAEEWNQMSPEEEGDDQFQGEEGGEEMEEEGGESEQMVDDRSQEEYVPNKGGRPQGPLWKYFVFEDGFTKCLHCSFKSKGRNCTTSLRYHLRTRHLALNNQLEIEETSLGFGHRASAGRPRDKILDSFFEFDGYSNIARCMIPLVGKDGKETICGYNVKWGKATTNRLRHIERHHADVYNEYQEQKAHTDRHFPKGFPTRLGRPRNKGLDLYFKRNRALNHAICRVMIKDSLGNQRLCGIRVHSAHVTGNRERHLENHHREIYKQYRRQKLEGKSKTEPNDQYDASFMDQLNLNHSEPVLSSAPASLDANDMSLGASTFLNSFSSKSLLEFDPSAVAPNFASNNSAIEFASLLPPTKLAQLARSWLDEDVTGFDFSGFAVGTMPGTAQLYCKQSCILAGQPFFNAVFRELNCSVVWKFTEGNAIPVPSGAKGVVAAVIQGSMQNILLGERVALNCLSRASGISTQTHVLKSKLLSVGWQGSIAATRKTTPGFRLVEKYAVVVGGGDSHRYNLSSAVMLKDNHVDAQGGSASLPEVVKRVKLAAGFTVPLEVEARNFEEAQMAAEAGADIVMLDNFSPKDVADVAQRLKERFPLLVIEVSGGISPENVADFAANDVDIISMGCLTQGYPCSDFSLKVLKL